MFKRSDSPETLVRKLAAGQWQDNVEKREMLGALRQASLRFDALARMLGAGDPEVTRFVLSKMAATKEPRAAETLLRALSKAPQGKQRPYIEALQTLASESLSRSMSAMVSHRDPGQRAVALEVLAGFPDWHDHLDVIKPLLKDPIDRVRQRAARLLAQGVSMQKVRPFLCAQLSNQDDIVRHVAIEALARDPDLEIVEAFFDRLPDEPGNIQSVMIRGMTKMVRSGGAHADRVMEQLLPLLAADDERIRAAAAKLLGSMPDTNHVLRRFLQYAKGIAFWLRDRSFRAVGQVARDLSGAMAELLQDEDLDVISGVLYMAGESRDERLVDGIIELTLRPTVDWWVRLNALETLHRFADPRVTPAIRSCLECDELRTAALTFLADRKDPESMAQVHAYLRSERRGLRMSALQAALRYQDPAFIPYVEQVAQNEKDEEVRVAALEILDSYGPEGVAAAATIREQRRSEQQAQLGTIELTME